MNKKYLQKDERPIKKFSATTIALVAVNIIPIIGVAYWDWSVFSILFLYWAENGVVGIYTIVRIAIKAKGTEYAYIPFFIVHYSIFMFVHLMFIIIFFSPSGMGMINFPTNELQNLLPGMLPTLYVALAGLFVSHGFSLFMNYIGNKEYENLTTRQVMMMPYSRIVIMHIVVLVGAGVVVTIGAPIASLYVLVILKIAVDGFMHTRIHYKIEDVLNKTIAREQSKNKYWVPW